MYVCDETVQGQVKSHGNELHITVLSIPKGQTQCLFLLGKLENLVIHELIDSEESWFSTEVYFSFFKSTISFPFNKIQKQFLKKQTISNVVTEQNSRICIRCQKLSATIKVIFAMSVFQYKITRHIN